MVRQRLPDPSEAAANLDGQALLTALLQTWPKVLSYLTSFTMIATFWQGHLRLFLQLRRFDGVLLWLVFFQLCSIAFLPFPFGTERHDIIRRRETFKCTL